MSKSQEQRQNQRRNSGAKKYPIKESSSKILFCGQGSLSGKWYVMLGSIMAFLLAQSITLYSFNETFRLTKQTFEATKEIAMVDLARGLANDFLYSTESSESFQEVFGVIESCGKLYKGFDAAGKFGYAKINKYLGFLDDIGLYFERGALDIEVIKHMFGSYIVETYAYPEVQKYISGIRKNSKESGAFNHFENLAKKLEQIEEYRYLAGNLKSACQQ